MAEKKDQKQETYQVFDMNARDGQERSHDVIVKTYDDGKEPDVVTYKLGRDKGTEMPQEHAMRFLIDPAFRVVRANGERVSPPPKYDHTLPLKVELDETIAKFEELNKTALYKRVKLLPGSEKLTIQSGNQELVTFLIENRKKQLRGNMSEAERKFYELAATGDLGGAASPTQVNRMFGDEGNDFIENVNRGADARAAA